MTTFAPLALLWSAGAIAFFLDGRRRAAGVFAIIALSAAFIVVVLQLIGALHHDTTGVVTGGWPAGVGIRVHADVLGLFFTAISLLVILSALLFEVLHGVLTRTFPAVMLLLGAGLTGLYVTGDLFNFYVFFEVSMLASFVLAAYGEEPREVRAAVVFALVNLVGSAFFLTAVAVLYRLAGTLDLLAMAAALTREDGTTTLVATLLFVAMGLKLGLFPFHFWLPAVYRSTRPVVAAVLSGAVANIGSYGLLRFGLVLLPDEVAAAASVLIALGAIGVVYAGVIATSRREPSEVLGYSAIGQASYVLIALGVGGVAGLTAAILYAAVNAWNKLVLFLTGGTGGRLAGVVFAIGALSVAGVPPTIGFAGKVELFRVGVLERSPLLIALVLVGSILSLIYMLQAYQHNFWAHDREQPRSPLPAVALVGCSAAVVIAGGLWPEPVLAISRAAATMLLQARP